MAKGHARSLQLTGHPRQVTSQITCLERGSSSVLRLQDGQGRGDRTEYQDFPWSLQNTLLET